MGNFSIVAIDGGAASGKSSSSRILAERFNLLHVDTGSFYRQVTHELLRRSLPYNDHVALRAVLAELQFSTALTGYSAQMLIGGQSVSNEIRSQSVNEYVAHYATIPEIRAALLGYQRDQVGVAYKNHFSGLVMEGRDINSKVFPDADCRFFLFADLVERSKRRAAEGQQDTIGKRDTIDSVRLNESLQGTTVIDSTHLTLDQVVEKMATLIAAKFS